jgi:hypothetical protein
MTYIIRKTSGEVVKVVEDGSIDDSTGIYLIGRSYVGYGEYISDNFIRLMENFSNDSPPKNPIEGQIWYDLSSKLLKVWKTFSGIGVWDTVETRYLSDISDVSTVDPAIGEALVWDGTSWKPGKIGGNVTRIVAGNNIAVSPANGLGNVTISSSGVGGAVDFDFGEFRKIVTNPITYLIDAVGMDFGTITNPANLSMDLGTF